MNAQTKLMAIAAEVLAVAQQVDQEQQAKPAAGNGWLQFSPLEEEILGVVCREKWTTREEIAKAIDQPPDGDVVVVLRNLVARRVLTSAPSRGYKLNGNH